MRILHIINSLGVGGAEWTLVKLSNSKSFAKDKILIVSLLGEDTLASKIKASNVRIIVLGINSNPISWLSLLRLGRIIQKFSPDIIQSWLYHSDIIAGIFGWVYKVPVVWGVRQSNLSAVHNKFLTRVVIKLCALMSGSLSHHIITNSSRARDAHISVGYKDKFIVIPNGFDTDVFAPCSSSYRALRDEIGINQRSIIVGMVGRYNSQKNYVGFLKRASLIFSKFPDIHFCLVGAGMDPQNSEIQAIIETSNIPLSQVHLLGLRSDIPYLMAGYDILGLPSDGESFPNVVGEAMASGVPCVVTDVGDNASIVYDTGRVVKVGDMEQFAHETINLLSLSQSARKKLGEKAREQIKVNYALEKSGFSVS